MESHVTQRNVKGRKKHPQSQTAKKKELSKGKAKKGKAVDLKQKKNEKIPLAYYEKGYDNLLSPNYRLKIGFQIGGTMAGLSYLLFMRIPIAIIFFVMGFLIGYIKIYPFAIKKAHTLEGFKQRNVFINSLTQILTNPQRTLIDGYSIVVDRLDGEFKKDIENMLAFLTGSTNKEMLATYKHLQSKYHDDIIFCQYIDQLITATFEGRNNIDTLKSIKTYHNDFKRKKELFDHKKNGSLMEMKVMIVVIYVFIFALASSTGFDSYKSAYAYSLVGIITSIIFLSLLALFFIQFFARFKDDNILEV